MWLVRPFTKLEQFYGEMKTLSRMYGKANKAAKAGTVGLEQFNIHIISNSIVSIY
jgi:hypothetical protein